MEIVREVIEEEMIGEAEPGQRRAALGWGAGSAGDQAKQMGLDYLGFGRYGKDGKTTHQSVDGKLTPVDQIKPQGNQPKGPPIKVSTSKPIGTKVADIGPGGKEMNVQTDPEWDKQNPEDRFGTDTSYLQVRKGATPAQRKLVGKVADMFDKVANHEFMTKHMAKSYPAAEFEKMTGIPPKAAKAFTDIVDDYEIPFQYDSYDDTVYIADPRDV